VIRLSGRLRSALIIGTQGIRAHKLRTLLSMISLFMGVLAVVVVQAGAESAQRALLSNVELQEGIDGTRQAYFPAAGDVPSIVLDTIRGRSDAIALATTQGVVGEPGVSPINPGGGPFDREGPTYYGPPPGAIICDSRGYCKGGLDNAGGTNPPGQAIMLRITAMTGDVRPFRPYRMQTGRWLDFAGPPSLAPGIVVNLEAAKGFTRYRVPAQLHIQGARADMTPRIVGVVDDGAGEPAAYLRADELMNWLPDDQLFGPYSSGMQLLLSSDADEVEQILRSRLAAAGLPSDRYGFSTIESKKRVQTELLILRLIFLGMAGLVLLIGVAGILNVGLATVGERIEEFALRRAVGTPRLLLAGIVLAETLLVGLFTAGAAIGVGAVSMRVIAPILASRQPILGNLTFPWQAAVAGVIAGVTAGLLGGLIPAIRAARIPIASVMRA
jgi:putative ABC transport system permease protein